MITAEQFAEWKTHPVTKEVFKEVNTVIEELKNQIISGSTIGINAESTHGMTNKKIGQIEGLTQLVNIYYGPEENKDEVNQDGY